MSLYGEYNSFYQANTPPHILGGQNRARNAARDRWGRFQPTSGTLEPPANHGRAGGLKRASTAKRASGKFARSEA